VTIAALMERRGPAVISMFALALYFFCATSVFEHAAAFKWDIGALYGAVFDTASMATAFLFSFLVFIKTTSNEFLSAFRNEPAYSRMLRDFRWSIIPSFVLSLVTIICLVTLPQPTSTESLVFWMLGAWFGFVTYVVGATVRSAYQFLAVLDAAYSKRFRQ